MATEASLVSPSADRFRELARRMGIDREGLIDVLDVLFVMGERLIEVERVVAPKREKLARVLAFLLERDGVTVDMLTGVAEGACGWASADEAMRSEPGYAAARLADADRLLRFLGVAR